MKFLDYIKFSKLLARQILGDVSQDDKKEIDSWLGEDVSNNIILKNIANEKNWNLRDENIKLLDKDLIWQNIHSQIKNKKNKPIFIYRKFFRYAAAILIPLALAYGGWNLYETTQNNPITQVAQIKPGSSKARLTIGNGRIIELGKRDTILNSEDKNIKIEIDSGRIEYKKNVLNKIKNESHILNTPRGGEMFLALSDGTKVWINSETEFKYPAVFAGNTRRVYLKGEALFEVAEDKEHPFVVYANGLNVEVLGTKFNISAYPDDDFVHATLVEGKVFVIERMSGQQQSAVLKPSQQAYYFLNTDKKLIIKTVDTNDYTSWTEGKFIFRNEALGLIFNKLSRWYNVDVFYDDNEIMYSKFSGNLPRFDNCETFLRLMEKTNSVKFEITESTVLVKTVK